MLKILNIQIRQSQRKQNDKYAQKDAGDQE